MKKAYEEIKLNVIAFEEEDILTASFGGDFDNLFSDDNNQWDSVDF